MARIYAKVDSSSKSHEVGEQKKYYDALFVPNKVLDVKRGPMTVGIGVEEYPSRDLDTTLMIPELNETKYAPNFTYVLPTYGKLDLAYGTYENGELIKSRNRDYGPKRPLDLNNTSLIDDDRIEESTLSLCLDTAPKIIKLKRSERQSFTNVPPKCGKVYPASNTLEFDNRKKFCYLGNDSNKGIDFQSMPMVDGDENEDEPSYLDLNNPSMIITNQARHLVPQLVEIRSFAFNSNIPIEVGYGLRNNSPTPKEFGPNSESCISVERFRLIPDGMRYYTGFQNYEHFWYSFCCLGPAAHDLEFKSPLSPENEYFLTLIKLRKASENQELGYMFNISQVQVGKIFRTWIVFMYLQLKELDLWIPKETIQEHMPKGFKKQFPNTRVILDATEIPIEKPQNTKIQSSTWSSYKNRNTLKTMVGISPSGCITYVSPLYGGATSDRQIMERSTLLLQNMMNDNDSIMADRGIMVQDLFAHQNVQVNTPTMLKGKNQLDAHSVIKDRRCSSKRVHVERLIGLAKKTEYSRNHSPMIC